MSLQKRIKRLHEQGKDVTIKEYKLSLISFDGYHAHESARNFWVGAILFVLVGFILFWIGTMIVSGQKPEVIRANAQAAKEARDADVAKKQQYIDGCKSVGKVPSDMGDYSGDWSCK